MDPAAHLPPVPWAQAAQRLTDAADAVLVDRAHALHPTATWWWGRLVQGRQVTAVCYVCGGWMVTWRNTWPLSDGGRDRIIRHRRTHLANAASSILATKETP